ncbi:MAG TPA: hypothetical protein PKA27_02260 [Fimbriimonadaceae bacterium]|nr:hypothetical protein [Fimbriimonadaceae bacterium]
MRTARKPFSGSFWSCIETSNGKAYFAEDTYDQAAAKAKAAVMAQVFDAVIYV